MAACGCVSLVWLSWLPTLTPRDRGSDYTKRTSRSRGYHADLSSLSRAIELLSYRYTSKYSGWSRVVVVVWFACGLVTGDLCISMNSVALS